MEPAGEPRPTGACSLLGVPELCSWDGDDDEDEVVIGIKPKSSPCPRRKNSVSSEDSEPELPPSSSRRVSFADALGLSLVSVKKFDLWDIPKPPGCDSLEGDGKEAKEYFLSTLFTPLSAEALALRVREQKLELEGIELLHGTTIVRGLVRVLNVSFDKMVYIRTTLDAWASHFDLLAEYIPGFSDGETDCFSFKLTLVPPFGKQGARVDFCLRYETPVGIFWANNSDRNYVVFCHQKVKVLKEEPQKHNIRRKSCLKTIGQDFASEENLSSTNADPTGVPKHGEEVVSVKSQESQSKTIEDDSQKLLVEISRNKSRRSRRRAARLARVQDYFSQKEEDANEKETGVVEQLQAQKGENIPPLKKQSNGPEIQPLPLEHNKSDGLHITLDSMATSNKMSPAVQLGTLPVLDSTSKEDSRNLKEIDLMGSPTTAVLGGEHTTAIPNNPSGSTDQPAPPSKNGKKSVCKVEGGALMQIETYKGSDRDESDISTDRAYSENDIRLENNTAVPVSQTNSFTFETVVAPLYHQVFCRVESESLNVTDRGHQMRGRLYEGDSATCTSRSYPFTEKVETCSSVSAYTYETHTEKPGDQRESLESDPEHLISGFNTQKESSPVSEEAEGLPRTHTASITVSFKAQISNENSGLLGQTEEPPSESVSLDESEEMENPHSANTAEWLTGTYTELDKPNTDKVLKTEVIQEEKTITLFNKEDLCDVKDVMLKDNVNEGHMPVKTIVDVKEKDWEGIVEEEEGEGILMDEEDLLEVGREEIRCVKEQPGEIGELGEEEAEITEEEKEVEDQLVVEEGFEIVGEVEENRVDEVVEEEEIQEDVVEEEVEEIEVEEEEIEEEEEEEMVVEEEVEIEVDEGEIEEEVVEERVNVEEIEEEVLEEMVVEDEEEDEMIEEEVVEIGEEVDLEDLDEDRVLKQRWDDAQNEAVDQLSLQMNNAYDGEDEREMEKDTENTNKEENAYETNVVYLHMEGDNPYNNEAINEETQDIDHPGGEEIDSINGNGESTSCIQTDEPAWELGGEDNISSESLSDDEMELYMNSLRAAQKQNLGQTLTGGSKDTALSVGKRPSISRRKSLLSTMPSISESVDEEHPSNPHADQLDIESMEHQATITLSQLAEGQDSARSNAMWWKDTFSCNNISKALLYTLLFLVFFVAAYHYDFLAYFALYLVSVFWLCCQGEKQPLKENNRTG